MSTVRYGDVVPAEDALEGTDLEEKLRKRRLVSTVIPETSDPSEVQQPNINTEHESK